MKREPNPSLLVASDLILIVFTIASFFGLLGMFIWGLFFDWQATLGIAAGTAAIGAFIWALLYQFEHNP